MIRHYKRADFGKRNESIYKISFANKMSDKQIKLCTQSAFDELETAYEYIMPKIPLQEKQILSTFLLNCGKNLKMLIKNSKTK